MRVCSISWNPKSEKIRINVTPEFYHSEWIIKADILQDAICKLTEEYNDLIAKQSKIIHENLKKKAKEDSVKLSAS